MTNKIIFAGGCFWCTEAIFQKIKGVEKVVSGYSGGTIPNPTYEQVTKGNTSHSECIEITYNEKLVTLEQLLIVFFETHDPTQSNGQGNDIGSQYMSAIFYFNNNQKTIIETFIKDLEKYKVFKNKIVTKVQEFNNFYRAEDYHQDFYTKNPEYGYCKVVIEPKLKKFEDGFKKLSGMRT